MGLPNDKVEVSFIKSKIHSFLRDVIELCIKHNVSIHEARDGSEITFHGWDTFLCMEVDKETASVLWPRIQTEIVVRRKNEYPKEASREKGKS